MLMFPDKVGGWGWPNAEVSKKKYPRKKLLREKKKVQVIFFWIFFQPFLYVVPWVGGYKEMLTSCLRWV